MAVCENEETSHFDEESHGILRCSPNFPHASICIQVYIVYTHTYGGLISHWGPQSIGHVVHGEWKPMLLGHSNFGKCPYDEHDEQHTVYRIQSNYQY